MIGSRQTTQTHNSNINTFVCVSERETTSENQCIDMFTERCVIVSVNDEVIRCQKHAEVEILRSSWFSYSVSGKVWHTIINLFWC